MVIRLALLLCLLAGPARAESLRLLVPEMQPVVSEMIPLTIRGEYTRQITLETLSFPNSEDYDWMQLSRDRWRNEEIEGRTVRVFERRIGIFPRHAGALTVGPISHHLTVVGSNNLREPLEVEAPPITLTVAPFPAEQPPLAVRSLTVEDELSAAPGALRDDETLVRRVTLKADGTLPHLLPPRPSMREPWLITFAAPERREMQPTPDGPLTTVTWEWHLRPKTGEPGVLPPVTVPWFDTTSRQMRAAEIPAIPFGYASFHDNGTGTERLPPGQVGTVLLVLAAGLATGLALGLAGLSRRRWGDVRRFLLRLGLIFPPRRALLRVAATGDLSALRRAAERYLRRRRDLGLPVTGRETAPLDAALYDRPGSAPPFDPRAAVVAILRHR
jgi:hypothetical protein